MNFKKDNNVLELAIKRTSLAEERTALAFIRTVAIFCGIYVLIRKNTNKKQSVYKFSKLLMGSICFVLLYRLYNLEYMTHKTYVIAMGFCVAICIMFLLIIL